METLLSQTNLDPMATLLLPGIVKFFGNLMYLYPEQVLLIFLQGISKAIHAYPDFNGFGCKIVGYFHYV